MSTMPNYAIKPHRKCLLFSLFLFVITPGFSQNGVAINTTGASASNSAMLDVSSTTAGMLVPRMTSAQKSSISSPATGLLIYQTDAQPGFYYYSGGWTQLGTATLGQSAGTVFGTGALTKAAAQTSFTLIPGLSTSVVVPASGSYYVYVATDGGIQTQSNAADGFSVCDIAIFVDGAAVVNGGRKRVTALNNPGFTGNFSSWSISLSIPLSAGTHTIAVQGASSGLPGQSATTIGGDGSGTMQPSLTVILLKQ